MTSKHNSNRAQTVQEARILPPQDSLLRITSASVLRTQISTVSTEFAPPPPRAPKRFPATNIGPTIKKGCLPDFPLLPDCASRFMDAQSYCDLVQMRAGRPLSACSLDFRFKVAQLRCVPIAETTIESKHQRVTVSNKKATNLGGVGMSLSNRMPQLMHHLRRADQLEAVAEVFGKARALHSAPELLGFASHPVVERLRGLTAQQGSRPKAGHYVKHLTSIIYNTECSGQFVNVSALKKQHDQKTGRDHITAAQAAQGQKRMSRSWELELFWDHARAKALAVPCGFVSLPVSTLEGGALEAVADYLEPRHHSRHLREHAPGAAHWDADMGEAGELVAISMASGDDRPAPQQLTFFTVIKGKPADAKNIFIFAGFPPLP